MQRAVRNLLSTPEVRQAFTQRLMVSPHYMSDQEVAQRQRAELSYWEPVIKASGFKPE
jgi:tripartite-type tricarboxylate transporter receptor subunit TctC